MKEKCLCVIKLNNKYYWCGLNRVSEKLENAQVYVDSKRAKEQADWILEDRGKLKWIRESEGNLTYKIIKIERELKIKELEEIMREEI